MASPKANSPQATTTLTESISAAGNFLTSSLEYINVRLYTCIAFFDIDLDHGTQLFGIKCDLLTRRTILPCLIVQLSVTLCIIRVQLWSSLIRSLLQDSVGVIQRVMALPPGVEPSCIY